MGLTSISRLVTGVFCNGSKGPLAGGASAVIIKNSRDFKGKRRINKDDVGRCGIVWWKRRGNSKFLRFRCRW
jgi:hypothetical protein